MFSVDTEREKVSEINAKVNELIVANKKSRKRPKLPDTEEVMHPLELKYGKEPPLEIKPEERWQWH
ncbi:MAG: hypothetical protein ACFFB2_01005 [Promethearchaeota archaeon]